jgi:hypothetical protein
MKTKTNIGYIDEYGKYHKGIDKPLPNDVDTQFKSYSHADQRRRFSKDIIQPYRDGKPNRDFVQAYDGELAERYFTKEQIKQSERSLS